MAGARATPSPPVETGGPFTLRVARRPVPPGSHPATRLSALGPAGTAPRGRYPAPFGISSASKTFLIAAIRRSSSAIAASPDQGISGAAIAAASG